MKSKEFFLTVQKAEHELKLLNARARHYEELGFSISGTAGVVGNKQRGTSRVEIAAIGNLDALRDLEKQKAEYLRIIHRAEKVISQITQEKYRQILSLKYLCGWSFRSISDELGYNDPNSIYRAHGWALVAAQEVLNKRESVENGPC